MSCLFPLTFYSLAIIIADKNVACALTDLYSVKYTTMGGYTWLNALFPAIENNVTTCIRK